MSGQFFLIRLVCTGQPTYSILQTTCLCIGRKNCLLQFWRHIIVMITNKTTASLHIYQIQKSESLHFYCHYRDLYYHEHQYRRYWAVYFVFFYFYAGRLYYNDKIWHFCIVKYLHIYFDETEPNTHGKIKLNKEHLILTFFNVTA